MEWNKFNEDNNLTWVFIGLLGEFYKWNPKVSTFLRFTLWKLYSSEIKMLGDFKFSISTKYGYLYYNTCIGVASNGIVIDTHNNNYYLLSWYVVILFEMV